MRDFVVWLAESLFHLTGGIELINTPYFFVWVVFWSVLMALPLLHLVNHKNAPTTYVAAIGYMVGYSFVFFFSLMMAISPSNVQSQLMTECETVEAVVETDRIWPTSIFVEQCHTKENYFDDFGAWQIRN